MNKIQPWWLCIAGGLLLVVSGGGSDFTLPSFVTDFFQSVGIVDPTVGQLATDSEAWARSVSSPKECAAVAACFDKSALHTGTATEMMEELRAEFGKALSADSQLNWVPFRTSVTTRLRLLRDAGKMTSSAKSHSAYMQAIAQGVRRAG